MATFGETKLVEMKECTLPANVDKAFKEVSKSLKNMELVPVLYAGQQVVNGINHIILAVRTKDNLQKTTDLVKIVININGPKNSLESIETVL